MMSITSTPDNINLRRWAIITLGLILTIALIILVWNKQPTIYPYLLAAIGLAILIVFSIVGYHRGTVDKLSTVCLILILFLFLRNVQFIATHFEALMPGDVTYEYAVINTFSQANKVFVIPPSFFSSRLTWYSSWPLLHTLSMIFGDVLDIKISLLPVILPTIFSLIGFLFVYLVADRLATDLKLNKLVVPIAILLYAISPETIYYGFKFVRNSLAVVFVLAEFYLLYKYISHRDFRILALIIINALTIALTHHYTSFIFTAYLLTFAGLTFILILISSRLNKPEWIIKLTKFKKEVIIIGIIGVIPVAGIFIWWSQIGSIIQIYARGTINKIVQVSIADVVHALSGIEPYILEAHYPEVLTPSWVNLLWVRDFLIYLPVIFGFVWLIRQKFKKKILDSKEEKGFHFLILSLVCFGAFFLIELFISHVQPYRIVLLSMPFIALCSAILYVDMLSHGVWLKWLTYVSLVFIIIAASLGLWGHRYAPINLYCSTVNAQGVGEATILDDKHYTLQQFINVNRLDLKSDRIFSDDNSLLYRLLSPPVYHKIGPSGGELDTVISRAIAAGDNLLVIDFNNKFYSHYWSGVGGHTLVESGVAQRVMTAYRTEIGSQMNKTYDNGFEIWLKQACTS